MVYDFVILHFHKQNSITVYVQDLALSERIIISVLSWVQQKCGIQLHDPIKIDLIWNCIRMLSYVT
jgi:hypothetical protein